MKVLLIAPYFFEPHRWMISAYKAALYLSKEHKVIVLTAGKPKYEKLNENLEVHKIFDIFIPDPVNYAIMPGLFFKLYELIRKEKPDVYIVNKFMFFSSFSIILLKLLGKKVITVTDTFPGIIWFSRNKFVKSVMWLYARVIGIPLLKMSDRVILLYEGLVPIAKKYRLNYKVIHNGVDFDKFNNAEFPADIKKKDNEIFVSYIGRLESIKGYWDLLDVAKDLVKKYSNIKFLFAGNIKGKEEIVEKYAGKQIMFLGHRNDVSSILKITDIFVLCSYGEGLPNALMEAMASEKACVASGVGAVPYLINNGKTGLIFQAGNKSQLKEKIIKLIQDAQLRQILGKEAKEFIYSNFNWQEIIKEYNKEFKRLIDKKG